MMRRMVIVIVPKMRGPFRPTRSMRKKMKIKSILHLVSARTKRDPNSILTGNRSNKVIDGSDESVGFASDSQSIIHNGLVIVDNVFAPG